MQRWHASFGRPKRIDAAAVLIKDGTCRLHVAHVRELQQKVNALRFTLGLQLRDLVL